MNILALFFSVYAINMKTGRVVLDEQSDLPLTPASCMKVVTTAAAYSLLNPEASFETMLEYDGKIGNDGILEGNLYIRGSGDPCLGSDRISPSLSTKEQIAVWVSAIESKGIQKIRGSIIGDRSLWESAGAVPSWQWEDIGNYFGAGAFALSFHENSYTLSFKPGAAVGDPTTIVQIDPPIARLQIENEVKTGPVGSGDLASIYGSEFSYDRVVRGTIPAGVETFSIKGSIPNPHIVVEDLLTKALDGAGISVENLPINETKRSVFHTTHSPPIKEIIHWANQKSINLYTEHLLKAMGSGSRKDGIDAVKNWLLSHEIDLHGFRMEDGSGLSRSNAASTKQLLSILLLMKDSPYFSAFYHSLPLQKGGYRAKTGTMSSIRGAVGFKDDIAFAIIINDPSNMDALQHLDSLLSQNEKIGTIFQ